MKEDDILEAVLVVYREYRHRITTTRNIETERGEREGGFLDHPTGENHVLPGKEG